MHVQFRRLSLMHFRNHVEADLQLGPQVNCFIGPNGVGKTNLLDAIHYLSLCKSYFDPIDQNNIRHGEDVFLLKGSVAGEEDDELSCSVRRGQKKVFLRNRKEYDRLADHVGRYPCVMITPYDGQLVLEGSELRRKFLDGLIAQFDRGYLDALVRYNRALAQRNVMLKRMAERGGAGPTDVEPWDDQLITHGTTVHAGRSAFLEELVPLVEQHYQGISNGPERIALEYRTPLQASSMAELLKEAWERDRNALHTTSGVHKDDLLFLIDDRPLKRFGSQGQQKTFLIALKLAQFDLTRTRAGRKPVLMLDDIFDKLDPQRMRHLLQLLAGHRFGQVLITDTDAQRLHRALDGLDLDVRFTISTMTKPSTWRPSNERSLGEALGDMIEAYGLREKLDVQELADDWNEVAGDMVARHTKDLALSRGRLVITVDSAPLRQELSYLKEDLIARINERLGREVVREVRLL